MHWELLAGIALIGMILAVAGAEVATALFAIGLLALCLWHWARVA